VVGSHVTLMDDDDGIVMREVQYGRMCNGARPCGVRRLHRADES
jgi:hypothetical protein